MTNKQFYTLFSDATEQADRDVFVSDWALSSIWSAEDPLADPGEDLIEQIGVVWDTAHLSIREMRTKTGMSRTQFAERFLIPLKTLEGWELGRPCAPYIRLMLAEILGIYKR